MLDLVIQGGTVIDGTGAPPISGDVLISDRNIERVGVFEAPVDAPVIDCRGLVVAPGFIDLHSHLDLQVLEKRAEKVAQGVTAEVVGNCGFSPYPAPPDRRLLHDFANALFCSDTDWGWPSARAYLEEAARSSTTAVFSLVGHGSLRIARVGHQLGQLAERDLDWMEQKLSESLEEGACGVSTGEVNVRISPARANLSGRSYPKNSLLFSRMARLSAPRYSCGAWPFCGSLAAGGQLRVHSRPHSKGRTTRLVARKARRTGRRRAVAGESRDGLDSRCPGSGCRRAAWLRRWPGRGRAPQGRAGGCCRRG